MTAGHWALGDGWRVVPTVVLRGNREWPAFRLFHDGTLITTSTDPEDLVRYVERARRVATTVRGAVSDRARCAGCHSWVRRDALRGERLGIGSRCPACAAALERRCRTRARRLPRAGEEFFCAGCDTIQRLIALTPRDADGRRRWRCRACRTIEVRGARQLARAGRWREGRRPVAIRAL